MTPSAFTLFSRHRSDDQQTKPLAALLLWLEPLWLALWAILITLPGLIFPTQWQPYVVAMLFAYLLLHLLIHRHDDVNVVSRKSILFLLLCLPITLLVGAGTAGSWQNSGYLLFGIAIYSIAANYQGLQQYPLRLRWLLVGLGTLLILASPPIVQWKSEFRLFYVPVYDWFQAIQFNYGETIHANVLAGAIILLLPVILGLAITPKAKPYPVRLAATAEARRTITERGKRYGQATLWTVGYWLLTLLLLALLLLTQSRGGYLAVATVTLLLGLLRWPRLTYLLPVLASGPAFFIYQSGLEPFFAFIGADNTFGGAEWRTPVWQAGWRAFQDFTWTGIGIGNFQQVMPLLYPNAAINNVAATHAHNLLLQIGLDLGLPGLVAYSIFYLTMIGMAIAVLRRTRSPRATAMALDATWDGHTIHAPPTVGVSISTGRFLRRLNRLERTRQQHWALAAGCLAALVGMQVHGLLDAVTWGNKLAFLPWLIFAQITLLYRYHAAPPELSLYEED